MTEFYGIRKKFEHNNNLLDILKLAEREKFLPTVKVREHKNQIRLEQTTCKETTG